MAWSQMSFADWEQRRKNSELPNSQDAPLGDLDVSKYQYASFIYPMDLGAPGRGKDHYMVFHINETATTQFPAKKLVKNADGTLVTSTMQNHIIADGENSAHGSVDPAPTASKDTHGASGGDATQNTYEAVKQPIRRIGTTIVLYMPNELTVNYRAEWQSQDLGAAKDLTDKIVGNGSWGKVLTSLGASALKNSGTALNEITGMNLTGALSKQTRLAINNHQEVIFNGIGFRNFQFSFRLTADSEEEAFNIDNIIRAFKFYSAPEILNGTAGRFWIYPAEFDIQYYSNGRENEFLNKISTCALVDMTINYNPVGHWSAHRPHSAIHGAQSVCTDMSLQFMEMEIMTKTRVLSGY